MVPQKSKTKLTEQRAKGPNVLWFAGLETEEQKKEFRDLMALADGPVYQRLLQILKIEIDRTDNEQLKVSKYDSPSWAYIQADNVGYKRGLRLIEELLKGIVK